MPLFCFLTQRLVILTAMTSGFLTACLLCVLKQESGSMMKGCTSVRPITNLEPSKQRPESVSQAWVCFSNLSYWTFKEMLADAPKLPVAFKYFHIFLFLLSLCALIKFSCRATSLGPRSPSNHHWHWSVTEHSLHAARWNTSSRKILVPKWKTCKDDQHVT